MTNIVESHKQVNRDMISPAIGEFAASDRERLIEELQAARDRAERAEREAATNADTIAAQQREHHAVVTRYEHDLASLRRRYSPKMLTLVLAFILENEDAIVVDVKARPTTLGRLRDEDSHKWRAVAMQRVIEDIVERDLPPAQLCATCKNEHCDGCGDAANNRGGRFQLPVTLAAEVADRRSR